MGDLRSVPISSSTKHSWRGGREAEGGGLLNRYTGLNLYREFESPPLRNSFREILRVLRAFRSIGQRRHGEENACASLRRFGDLRGCVVRPGRADGPVGFRRRVRFSRRIGWVRRYGLPALARWGAFIAFGRQRHSGGHSRCATRQFARANCLRPRGPLRGFLLHRNAGLSVTEPGWGLRLLRRHVPLPEQPSRRSNRLSQGGSHRNSLYLDAFGLHRRRRQRLHLRRRHLHLFLVPALRRDRRALTARCANAREAGADGDRGCGAQRDVVRAAGRVVTAWQAAGASKGKTRTKTRHARRHGVAEPVLTRTREATRAFIASARAWSADSVFVACARRAAGRDLGQGVVALGVARRCGIVLPA